MTIGALLILLMFSAPLIGAYVNPTAGIVLGVAGGVAFILFIASWLMFLFWPEMVALAALIVFVCVPLAGAS